MGLRVVVPALLTLCLSHTAGAGCMSCRDQGARTDDGQCSACNPGFELTDAFRCRPYTCETGQGDLCKACRSQRGRTSDEQCLECNPGTVRMLGMKQPNLAMRARNPDSDSGLLKQRFKGEFYFGKASLQRQWYFRGSVRRGLIVALAMLGILDLVQAIPSPMASNAAHSLAKRAKVPAAVCVGRRAQGLPITSASSATLDSAGISADGLWPKAWAVKIVSRPYRICIRIDLRASTSLAIQCHDRMRAELYYSLTLNLGHAMPLRFAQGRYLHSLQLSCGSWS